jgi:outer membrane protein TolC
MDSRPHTNSRDFYRSLGASLALCLGLMFAPIIAFAAESGGADLNALNALINEAIERNPDVLAVRAHAGALKQVPIQESTLPDPEISFQQLTVGSAAPFSGYETSDFYYSGFAASQDIPGPGKLHLRGARAEHEAEAASAQLTASQRRAAEQVREAYFNLVYYRHQAESLTAARSYLDQASDSAQARYRSGQGSQADIAVSQVHVTQILRQVETNRSLASGEQAALHAALGRPIDSPSISVDGLPTPTKINLEPSRLAQIARGASADLRAARALEASSETSVALARREYLPDFTVGYTYQKTGPGMRDYFMLTVGAKIPLYAWRRQTPALEQAVFEKASAEHRKEAAELDVLQALERSAIAARSAERIIAIYRDGLIPQGATARESAMAAYRSGQVGFQQLIDAIMAERDAHDEYARAIADHEIAIAKIKEIAGENL